MLHRIRLALRRKRKAAAQALVEFALAATLIFLLLAAAVDLGLIYMMVQALHNAAQEGAAYGSRWMTVPASGPSTLDYNGIRQRVRLEAGASGGVAGINLLDLNADGTPDDQQPDVLEDFIEIKPLLDASEDGDPTRVVATGAAEEVACTNPSDTKKPCYVWVRVSATYRSFFPFATVFGAERNFSSTYIMPTRNSFTRSSVGDQEFSTATSIPSPSPVPPPSISVTLFRKDSGNRPVFVKVYVSQGGSPLTGAFVSMKIGSKTYTLGDVGGGYYALCGTPDSFGGSTAPAASFTASYQGATGDTSWGGGSKNAGGSCP
ncbi:MAG TPA: TadE family protein [Roseiflexaceae bacterium]|nr:TadE family protein [Roseiflexaceae bacterium]